MWLRCWRILALQALVFGCLSAAEAGETSATLRVTARVVERCTFTTPPWRQIWRRHLRAEDVLDARCRHRRPVRLTIAPVRRPLLVRADRHDDTQHLQITVTY